MASILAKHYDQVEHQGRCTPIFSPMCSESSLVQTETASQRMAPVPHQIARCYCKFVELINNNGKARYMACCSVTHLNPNTKKTKEIIIGIWKLRAKLL